MVLWWGLFRGFGDPGNQKKFWTNRRLRTVTNWSTGLAGAYLILHSDWTGLVGDHDHIFKDIQLAYQQYAYQPVMAELRKTYAWLKWRLTGRQ
mmetsp:Transcript_2798/g.10671  ORF Transcript_2798/g.10671 Transcript_2798/m.10671 type:complete len:93 (+) Transcript_2798:84-362(+)